MSGNHYSNQVLQLEDILSKKVAQLVILQTENARLKQKEQALQSCILGIEGSVAATRAVLEVEAQSDSLTGATDTSRSGDAGCTDTVSGDVYSAAAGTASCDQAISSIGSAAAQAVLQALADKEQQVQAALAQLGCCSSSYSELYSTRVLRKATADPAHALAILSLSRSERRNYLVHVVRKLALLLPKYDSKAPSTSLGSAKDQLHAAIDELSERILVAGLLDPPAKKLDNMLINLETMEYEAYPQGYWTAVAQSLQLTVDQKAALKLCCARVKVNKATLTEQHSRLTDWLQQMQLQQQQVQQQFEEQAARLQGLHLPYSAKQKRRTQEALAQQRQAQQSQQQQQQQQGAQGGAASQQLQQTSAVSTPQLSSTVPRREFSSPPEMQQQQLLLLQQQGLLQLPTRVLLTYAQPCTQLAEQRNIQPQQQQQQQSSVPAVAALHQAAMHAGPQQLQPLQSLTALLQDPHEIFDRGTGSSCEGSHSNLAPRGSATAQQHQQQQAQQYHAAARPTTAAAAAAAMPPSSRPAASSSTCNWFCSPEVSGGVTDTRETSRGSCGSAAPDAEAMLLPMSGREQQGIEQQLAVITEKLKMQHFCQALQFHNVLTYRHLAGLYVDAWPFVPDALSLCEALDELGWQ